DHGQTASHHARAPEARGVYRLRVQRRSGRSELRCRHAGNGAPHVDIALHGLNVRDAGPGKRRDDVIDVGDVGDVRYVRDIRHIAWTKSAKPATAPPREERITRADGQPADAAETESDAEPEVSPKTEERNKGGRPER